MTEEEQRPKQIGIQTHNGDISIEGSSVHIAGRDQYVNYPSLDDISLNKRQKRDRLTLLNRVRAFWIGDVLKPSMEGATFIPLGLYDRPDMIENPWKTQIQEAKRVGGQLAAGTSLIQVYDEGVGDLLVLGEPGSGKTTSLLYLLKELLERAERDETQRMPAVFNLSSWADKRQPITEWLIEELSTKYQITKTVGKPWVDMGEVLPVLDGLDEVAEEHRAACVEAINTYRKIQGHLPLIIGSRLAEYTVLNTKIVLRRAVMIQPMTLPQIQEYLEKAEGAEGTLQKLLRNEPDLQELATNPLMLHILRQTYQGGKVEVVQNASPEERRHQIFTDYVQSVFQRRSERTPYSSEKTIRWLIWLAKQMKKREQESFYLERLQIDWVTKSRIGEIYTSLAFGLLSFPVAFIVYTLEYSVYGIRFALINGTLASLLMVIIAFFFVWFIETDIRIGLLFRGNKQKNVMVSTKKKGKIRSRIEVIFTPLLIERSGFALLSGLLLGILVEVLVGPVYALINGLFVAAFLVVLGKFERKIQAAEILVWTWTSVRKHALGSLSIGLAIGLFGGIFDAFPYFSKFGVFLTTLVFWLSLGTALGMIIMLVRGFSSDQLDAEQVIKPNQGIRNSLSNSLRVGLSLGASMGLVIFFFYSYIIHNVFVVGYISEIPENAGIVYGVGDAIAVTYLFWLINGGFATVQHFVLRVLLWRTQCTPWRYPRFLDYANERILLRKSGGGYRFIHMLLRNYFADLATEKDNRTLPAESTAPAEPDSTQSSSDDEDRKALAVPLLYVPALSEVPHMLQCGHEQRNIHMRFCSTCGQPVLLQAFEE